MPVPEPDKNNNKNKGKEGSTGNTHNRPSATAAKSQVAGARSITPTHNVEPINMERETGTTGEESDESTGEKEKGSTGEKSVEPVNGKDKGSTGKKPEEPGLTGKKKPVKPVKRKEKGAKRSLSKKDRSVLIRKLASCSNPLWQDTSHRPSSK